MDFVEIFFSLDLPTIYFDPLVVVELLLCIAAIVTLS